MGENEGERILGIDVPRQTGMIRFGVKMHRNKNELTRKTRSGYWEDSLRSVRNECEADCEPEASVEFECSGNTRSRRPWVSIL
jgi:hypothetical protein